jgi:hypothetical protein
MDPVNKHKGEIEIDLGRKRIWRLLWKDVGAVENALEQLRHEKVNWLSFRSKFQNWSIDEYALVLWAGLRWDDPQLTLEWIKDNADWTLVDCFTAAFAESLQSALPERYRKNFGAAAPATETAKSLASESTSASAA